MIFTAKANRHRVHPSDGTPFGSAQKHDDDVRSKSTTDANASTRTRTQPLGLQTRLPRRYFETPRAESISYGGWSTMIRDQWVGEQLKALQALDPRQVMFLCLVYLPDAPNKSPPFPRDASTGAPNLSETNPDSRGGGGGILVRKGSEP